MKIPRLLIKMFQSLTQQRIQRQIQPTFQYQCRCRDFLSPVTSWKAIYDRHDVQSAFIASLISLTENLTDDWTVDIYRCQDCGRYWAREEVGKPFLTKSLAFFYYINPDDPEKWIRDAIIEATLVLDVLDEEHEDYKTLIHPKVWGESAGDNG